MKKFFGYSFLILLFGILFYCLGYLIVGEIKRSPNVIIKQDSEYMWVKEYSLYNEDSCVYKYHQPIIYEGIVVDRRSHFQGVPGKGGHRVYRTDICYNENVEHTETGWSYYDSHKEGDKVKVKVSFYPWEKIEVLN